MRKIVNATYLTAYATARAMARSAAGSTTRIPTPRSTSDSSTGLQSTDSTDAAETFASFAPQSMDIHLGSIALDEWAASPSVQVWSVVAY
jgi:hypothetical protein